MNKKPSSKALYEFYKELEAHDIENHGLLIMQGQDVVYEKYAYPYSADMPHTLFSVTKSIVSTAAGFAIDEGLLSLNTKIIDVFPQYKACKSHEWESLTLRSVLTMSSNKQFTFLQDMTGNYVEMFMKAPFRKNKGFLYSNNDAHIVAAAVEKMAGTSLVEYLTPRLFKPLGIKIPFWETNSIGECIGGTGCYLTLPDLVKICRCYADGGKYKGEQVIPEFWTREATKIQVPFKNDKGIEEGYGYLFWIENGVVCMSGMFGQRISYCPENDVVVGSLNSCIKEGQNNLAIDSLAKKLYTEESSPQWDEKLQKYLEERDVLPRKNTEEIKIPTNKTYYITKKSDRAGKLMFPQSIIPRPITVSLAKRPKSNLDKVSFSLSNDVFTVKWKEEEDEITINCGLDGNPRVTENKIKGYPYKMWAYAYCEGGIIKAVVKPLNTLSTHYISFSFSDDSVDIQFKGTPDFPQFIKRHVDEVPFVTRSEKLKGIVLKCADMVLLTVEKPIKFKIKN